MRSPHACFSRLSSLWCTRAMATDILKSTQFASFVEILSTDYHMPKANDELTFMKLDFMDIRRIMHLSAQAACFSVPTTPRPAPRTVARTMSARCNKRLEEEQQLPMAGRPLRACSDTSPAARQLLAPGVPPKEPPGDAQRAPGPAKHASDPVTEWWRFSRESESLRDGSLIGFWFSWQAYL